MKAALILFIQSKKPLLTLKLGTGVDMKAILDFLRVINQNIGGAETNETQWIYILQTKTSIMQSWWS